MKKKLLLLSNVILLSSCNVFVNNSLPNEKKTIVGDFGNIVKDKVTITDENGHDFSNQKLMVKGTLNDTVDHLIIGDEVEIYYKDDSKTEIDHVFVIPAKVVKLINYEGALCGTPDDLIFYTEDFLAMSTDVKFVCKEDFSFMAKRELNKDQDIYGTYQKMIDYNNPNDKYKGEIYLLGLFIYNPR